MSLNRETPYLVWDCGVVAVEVLDEPLKSFQTLVITGEFVVTTLTIQKAQGEVTKIEDSRH